MLVLTPYLHHFIPLLLKLKSFLLKGPSFVIVTQLFRIPLTVPLLTFTFHGFQVIVRVHPILFCFVITSFSLYLWFTPDSCSLLYCQYPILYLPLLFIDFFALKFTRASIQATIIICWRMVIMFGRRINVLNWRFVAS